MEFGSLAGGDDGEYSGKGFVVIFKIFAMQDSLLFGNGVI